MEESFASARLDSIRINKYLLKHNKNEYKYLFLATYLNSKGEVTENLKKATFLYKRAHMGSLDTHITDTSLEEISDEEINDIYKEIKEGAFRNFIEFYESYRRKIDKSYDQDIIDNAFGDLKTAYSTYRIVNNPLWNLKKEQITEKEMTNLYNILVPQTGENPSNPISKEEK